MTSGIFAALGGVLVAIITGVFGYLTKRAEKRSSDEVTIYERVARLEEKVEGLVKDRDNLLQIQRSLVDHIEDLYRWELNGHAEPKPVLPFRIRDLIDRVYWDHWVADHPSEKSPND